MENLIYYGILVIGLLAITYVSITSTIAKYLDKDKNIEKALFDYMNDIGFKRFLVIQTILKSFPYLFSGALLIILISFWSH